MVTRGKNKGKQSILPISDHGDDLASFGGSWSELMPAVVEADIQRTAPIHILLKFSCHRHQVKEQGEIDPNSPIAVSASGIWENCTTPHPFDLVPSNRISATSTVPVVSNNSTKSSLAVDHGS